MILSFNNSTLGLIKWFKFGKGEKEKISGVTIFRKRLEWLCVGWLWWL